MAVAGYLVPSRCLSVRVHLSVEATKSSRSGEKLPGCLKHRARVRLHLGTAELTASVSLLGRDKLGPGEWGYAQLLLNQPAVATWGQPFILRHESPAVTIGGGHVLDPDACRLRRGDEAAAGQIAAMESGDPLARTAAAVESRAWRPWEPGDLVRLAGITDAASGYNRLLASGLVLEISVGPSRRPFRPHRRVLDETCRRMEAALSRMHDEAPLMTAFQTTQVASRLGPWARRCPWTPY